MKLKTILILNNQAYTIEKKKELQSIAVRRIIERAIKKIETEKYDFLEFNQIDLDIQINSIAQRPKIKKYSKKMKNTISKICEINPNQINIKGKTTEKLGLIGKGKAIACETISSVMKND